MNAIVSLKNVSVVSGGTAILHPLNLRIRDGEQWAIIGSSGSGKTTLAHALTGKIFHQGEIIFNLGGGKPAFVEQQHHFKNLSNTSEFYYQQRFNSMDADNSITVREALGDDPRMNEWTGRLHLDALMDKPLIQLSNGENKRLQLVKVLQAHPPLIIFDNPFTGLDIEGRKTFDNILNNICHSGIHILIITNPATLPSAITHVALLVKGRLVKAGRKDVIEIPATAEATAATTSLLAALAPHEAPFSYAVKMTAVTVRYGDKIILDNINWIVKKGDCWRVSGPNGAGKSTLLSLLTADNPQAYANEVYLFDQRRGAGESIWDIKKRIGYISPELHLHFDQSSTCSEVIASGLFDTIGLFRLLSDSQRQIVSTWLDIMHLEEFQHKTLRQLSTGQQRMTLLARAMVKNPPVLILDEPCQGLDDQQVTFIRELVDRIHSVFNTTVIYVSHYDHELPSCIDKFLELENGKIK